MFDTNAWRPRGGRQLLGGLGLMLVFFLGSGCESALVRQTSYFSKTRDSEGARELLRSTLASDPNHAEALYLLGRLQYDLQEYSEGTEMLARSQRASPRYDDEIAYLRALHLNSAFADGAVHLENGDATSAAARFTHATEIDSSLIEGYLGLGQALEQVGLNGQAELAYRTALLRQAESEEALTNLAELLIRKQDYAEALSMVTRLLQVQGDLPTDLAHEKLFYAQLGLGEFEAANQAFSKVTRPSAELRHNSAAMNHKEGNHAVARDAIRPLTNTLEDRDGFYSVILGESLLALKEYDDMAVVFERLVRRFPQNRDMRTNLVIAYDMIGFHAEADSQRTVLRQLGDSIPETSGSN